MYNSFGGRICDLGISQGELLRLAREACHCDTINTLDRLTGDEYDHILGCILEAAYLTPA